MVTWDTEGIKYEADQRHVEIILKQLGLELGAKAVVTPGIKQEAETWLEDGEELCGQEASMFRAITARANYLSQDRSDIQFAVKEVSRAMSCPTAGDRKQLKRLGR